MKNDFRILALGAAVGAAVVSASHATAETRFQTPPEYGLVFGGEPVAYELDGSCEALCVCAEVDCDAACDCLAARTCEPEGIDARAASIGCSGVVTIPEETTNPSLKAIDSNGVVASRRLAPKRIEAENATVVAGDAGVTSAADDPFSPTSALDVLLPGTTVSLGMFDTTGVSSVSLRAATDASLCHPSYEDGAATYCRAGEVVIAAGSPDGPRLGIVEIPGSEDDRPWKRTVSETARINSEGPVELFATVIGPPTRINYVELNGSGVAEPHSFPPDPPGTIVLLDESPESYAKWRMVGSGSFEREEDGSIRSFAGYGLFWYGEQQLGDGSFRAEFKVDSPDANSGFFVRFADPAGSALGPSATGYEVQIQDYGQAYFGTSDSSQTGSIYARKASSRIATRTVGEWNTLEVRTVGHEYTVWLNGEKVNEYVGDRRLTGYVGVQNHDPTGTVWFRHIRFIPDP